MHFSTLHLLVHVFLFVSFRMNFPGGTFFAISFHLPQNGVGANQARRSSGRLDQARNAMTSPTMWSSYRGQHWAPQAWAQWNAWSGPWQWSHWSGAPNTPANGDGLPTYRRDGPSDHQWNSSDAAATGFLLPRLLTHGNIGGHMVLNGPACLDNSPAESGDMT